MKHMMKRAMAGLGLVCATSLGGVSVQAAGFANNDFSASGVGAANAVVAGIADVSAASYNPAAIAWLEGVHVQGGFATRFRNSSVKSGAGVQPNTGKGKSVAAVHASWMPHDSNFGLSVAWSRPFLNNTIWGGDLTDIQSERLSVDLIYAVSSTLSVASGLDVYKTKVRMTQGGASFSGTDTASFGGNIGVNWKPAPLWGVGLLLRSGTKAKVKSGIQSLELRLPEQVTLGVSYDMNDSIRLEADVAYERWSRLKNLNVQGSTITYAAGLSDTVAIKTAATWYWLPDTMFRFGYAYEQGANSKSNFQAAIADQSSHTASLGAGGALMGMHIDLAYAYQFHSKKSVTAPIVGQYRDRKQSFVFSVSKAF